MLKKFTPLLLVGAMLMLVTGCNNDDDPVLSVDLGTGSISFSAAATESYTFDVTSSQKVWNAVPDQDWCTVTKSADGKSFTVTATENTTPVSPAPATVTITANNARPLLLRVSQDGAATQLSVYPQNYRIDLPLEGGEVEYTVATNEFSWDAVSDEDWCVVEKADDGSGFTVTATLNYTGSARPQATVTVTAGEGTPVEITVNQPSGPDDLTVYPFSYSIDFPAQGGTETYTVFQNVRDWDVVSTEEWCVVEKNPDGLGFTVTAQVNNTGYARAQATVTVSAGSNTPVAITVDQAAGGEEVLFQDQKFKGLLQYRYPELFDANGEIDKIKAAGVSALVIDPQDTGLAAPTSLAGIEAFANLQSLEVINTAVTATDLSANTELRIVRFTSNKQLRSLDIAGCGELRALNCDNNTDLSTIDVSSNTKLLTLSCMNNNISSLDVSSNIALVSLNCAVNRISSLDISANTELAELNCRENLLTSLDASAASKLTRLTCGSNALATLNISGCTALEYLYAADQQLEEDEKTEIEVWSTFDTSSIPAAWSYDEEHVEWVQ